jgi:hypothetical protein
MIRLLACALALLAVPVQAAPDPAIVDLTGAYVRTYQATKDLPPADRVARFKADVVPLFPGFYSAERIGLPQEKYDAFIARSFERFPAIEADFAARAGAVASQLADAQADFTKAFPGKFTMPPTYLLHSLGEMDGGTREIGGKTVLVFGADVMARAHAADANERPFFQHELFHVYHEPKFAGCEAIWCSLWEEGLATYVAASLNPGAKPADLLLDPETLAAIKADPKIAVCTIRRVAVAKDEDAYRKLFNGGAHFPGLPDRAGYYVGFLVAEGLAKGRTLRTIADWTPAEAKPKVLAELAAMAPDCPG